LNHYFVVI